jgi:hypothetical protein
MLKELKFVQSAVAKKELIPGMTHFAIEDNTIRSYNGSIALCSPIAFDINCKPKAIPLIQAISNCSEEFPVTMSMTPGGKLQLVNGPYRVLIDCIEEETPHVQPEGETVLFDGETVCKAFNAVIPFVGTDAARPWTTGILLSGSSAMATNNVCIVEYWLGRPLPIAVNVPVEAAREVLRVGEIPDHLQLTHNSISFHFPGGRWIRSALLNQEWPKERFMEVLSVGSTQQPIDPKIFEGLDAIKPFIDSKSAIGGSVFFQNGMLTTHESIEQGATFELENFGFRGCYAWPMLKLLQGLVDTIDWSGYPKPCLFFGAGGMLRGALIGRAMTSHGEE